MAFEQTGKAAFIRHGRVEHPPECGQADGTTLPIHLRTRGAETGRHQLILAVAAGKAPRRWREAGWPILDQLFSRRRVGSEEPTRAVGRAAVQRLFGNSDVSLFVGPNQIDVADTERQCEFIDRNDRWISSAFLQTADVLLTEPGNFGKLFLRQTLP